MENSNRNIPPRGQDVFLNGYRAIQCEERYLNNPEQPLQVINVHETRLQDANFCFDRQNYPFWVFELVVEGAGQVQIEDDHFSVETGDIYILPQNRNHIIWSDRQRLWRKKFFCVSGALPGALLRSYSLDHKFFFPGCQDARFAPLFDAAISLFRCKAPDWTDKIAGLLLQLVQLLAQQSRPHPGLSCQVLTIIHYMELHLHEELSLKALCQKLNLPRNRVIQLCREELQKTPYEYFLTRKLEVASQMLAAENVRISDVAMRMGFADPYYFSRLFKKKLGVTPSQFRRQNRTLRQKHTEVSPESGK